MRTIATQQHAHTSASAGQMCAFAAVQEATPTIPAAGLMARHGMHDSTCLAMKDASYILRHRTAMMPIKS